MSDEIAKRPRMDPSNGSFVTVAPITADMGWVVMVIDDVAQQGITHSALLRYNKGAFEKCCLRMFRTKHIAWLSGTNEAVFVGDTGDCTVLTMDQLHTASDVGKDEYVAHGENSPRNLGDIRGATVLGDDVIAVGMNRQIYRRVAGTGWTDMMQGMHVPEETTGFECVLALAPDEIYVAGWNGELWVFDGEAWSQIKSPTSRVITSMCLGPDGEVIACGQGATIIQGRRHAWRCLPTNKSYGDLWAVECFKGKVYTAGLSLLFSLEGDSLLPVEGADVNSFGVLAVSEDTLWSAGDKDLSSFDGANWQRLNG